MLLGSSCKNSESYDKSSWDIFKISPFSSQNRVNLGGRVGPWNFFLIGIFPYSKNSGLRLVQHRLHSDARTKITSMVFWIWNHTFHTFINLSVSSKKLCSYKETPTELIPFHHKVCLICNLQINTTDWAKMQNYSNYKLWWNSLSLFRC